ncbi:MAG: 4Fe-4S binding protein [Spirochaetes bacterium]|nr:4Fe-4S binding protein [Spirochaetota bacterium]
MKRQIIRIDEELCNGCGQCITGCPEGAITVEVREAESYSERRVMEGIATKGPAMIAAHMQHLNEHGGTGYLREAQEYLQERGIAVPMAAVHSDHGCPGSRGRSIAPVSAPCQAGPADEMGSALRQWPVQLALVNPGSPSFDGVDLLVTADCVPFAHGDFHRRFLAGKSLVMFCPKLDGRIDGYVEKLTAIFSMHRIRSVSVVRMEVACCGGIGMVVRKALDKSGASFPIMEHIITIDGGVAGEGALSEARAL